MADAEADAIADLPGFGKPPSPQWSGFLNASTAQAGTMLHYWFALAEKPNAHELPVVLWLNGGPGSSSVLGMLQEHGPLLINATGGLMRNPYAWTKQANLLIIESPAGVGYSYCAEMVRGAACTNSDKSTAKAARAAIQDFFQNKFPTFRQNPFYITGESYAGVYVPTLTAEILQSAPEIKLKCIAVGDPCTDNAAQSDSMDMLWYAHKYGLVPDSDFELLWNNCSYRHPSFLSQGNWLRTEGHWSAGRSHPTMSHLKPAEVEQCKVAHRRFLASSSRAISQDWPLAWLNDLTLYGPAALVAFDQPGSLNFMMASWMMRDDVRRALHVDGAPAKKWPGPPPAWSYKSDYSACNAGAEKHVPSMIDFYRRIAPKLARTIVFNGDTDPCVSYEGTRAAIKQVGFDELPGHQYRPWFYRHSSTSLKTLLEKPLLFGPDLSLIDAGAQFGGHVVDYAHNLSFVTVHGSGHMVPQFRPQAAEHLLHKLLTGGDFSPPLPSNANLAQMSDGAFDKMLDTWTVQAKASAATSALGHTAMEIIV